MECQAADDVTNAAVQPRRHRRTARRLADFEGMRVRATGGLGNAFSAVGGVPTSVTATEAYQAMESGVVDTVAFAQHAHLSFGTINQADWWTANLNPGTVNCPVVVNIDAYEVFQTRKRAALDSPCQRRWTTTWPTTASCWQRWDSVLAKRASPRSKSHQK